ncbi:Hypothetical predicted protein [Cloeon dipterum]|uniref:Uncharacterized protein n=1 Tax=Cloeon dipterum TaxID=197152 RepID=A0A8S1DAD0_9INSE|nr:Hypothetical predicted protein [Cloeon dipterum]
MLPPTPLKSILESVAKQQQVIGCVNKKRSDMQEVEQTTLAVLRQLCSVQQKPIDRASNRLVSIGFNQYNVQLPNRIHLDPLLLCLNVPPSSFPCLASRRRLVPGLPTTR